MAGRARRVTQTGAGVTLAMAQVPIFEILKKYDGVRIHDDIKNGRRRCAPSAY